MPTEHLTDADLAAEPAPYWTGRAHEAVLSFTRAWLGELGFTQPQYWLLRNLSKHDLSPDGTGMTVPELQQAMSSYLRPEDDLATDSKALVERGLLTRDDAGRLWITEAGETSRAGVKARVPDFRTRLHEGIDDADYVTTLKVLRQMLRNAGRQVD
ncbi:MarR family winged helix-turn-helix transcriptional regulator [Streptomyces sp. HUAS MG47]|uniref:MarR family winged helix-turn-helix transcriptional regulator n=1 Tax=Streptomyces solicamelliae TaxID=3231716 RepID=UPI0038781055